MSCSGFRLARFGAKRHGQRIRFAARAFLRTFDGGFEVDWEELSELALRMGMRRSNET